MSLAHLGQAMRQDKSSGLPLKTVWKSLANQEAVFRRGQLALVGAGSGTGKSVFALNLAIRSGAKTIYFSADSGPGTQLSRVASIITGKEVRETKKAVENGNYFDKELKEIGRIRWEMNAAPSLDDIDESLEAYAVLHGEYPELVICDNLLNIVSDESGEGGYKTGENILLFLLELARKTGACILVLHHLTGEYANGDKPAPLSALRDKVDKVIELVLTLHKIDEQTLGVCIVKNREGEMDASGGLVVELDRDFSRMLITDPVSHVKNGMPF